MVPVDSHQFKTMVTIILVSRVVVHPLEEVPLPRVECYQTAVVLPVTALLVTVVPGMEVLRPMIKPLINRMAVEATVVGTVAAVDRRTVVTGATVARQAEVAMVVQEDKTTAAVTWVMETRMAVSQARGGYGGGYNGGGYQNPSRGRGRGFRSKLFGYYLIYIFLGRYVVF